ncbi:large conductance mechanosensitive channel protein MscL [Aeoliella mucimassa]|uniref:Large-conductance mechanosensitive channel n=1 Tax=Aeoliella mucimassa TaxID=2527972 RepID=A0A518AJL3_9BACT|nr:large conductance mechanosensitive channel protein MscL [Aeoliella mucimassa]QDU54911.1 Large-conductance mechanosensitive channel [Aeoliella mucimassa]
MGLIQEFQKFAMRGNVVDMAVGIIMGGAFGKIVASFVGDILMPVVGSFTGKGSLGSQFLWLDPEVEKPASLAAAREAGGPYIAWGAFVQTTIDFLIIAISIFLVVKLMNRIQEEFVNKPEAEKPAPPEDILLLREIRDALKKE